MKRIAFALSAVLSACVRYVDPPTAAASGMPVTRPRADVHLHLAMPAALPLFEGEIDGPVLAHSPEQIWVNQLTTEGLRRVGISLVFAATWTPFALRPGRTAMDEAIGQMRELRRFVDSHPAFAIATSADHARRLMDRDLIAVVPALEGAEMIEAVDDVDVLFAAGYRVIGLVHFTDNPLADAHDGQFGPILARLLDARDGALTPLGRDAIRRMFQLGIAVDLAHTSSRARDEALAIAEEASIPVLYSHEGAGWNEPWTLGDEHARRIVSAGGLVGMAVFRHHVLRDVPEDEKLELHAVDTCDDVVAMWKHYARVVGPRGLVLGSDFNTAIKRPRPGGRCPNGLRHVGDLSDLFEALAREGIPPDAWDGTAARVLAFLERIEALADVSARSRALRERVDEASYFDSPL